MKNKFIFALGFFDGVHLGHQALLRSCCELAKCSDVFAGAVTFLEHPDALVLGQMPPLINTASDRAGLLKAFGAERVLELPFDRKMMTMPWHTFLKMLVEDHCAAGFVCGEDFRFGYQGQGNSEKLADFCAENALICRIEPQVVLDGTAVSSTHIRGLLERGEVETANRFLGHPHILSGEVISGRHLGRTLGIPTANLLPPENLVALPHGVYACAAIVADRRYTAVTNIGSRPTVGGHRVTVEPWILDFDGDLYGKTLTLEFHRFLRPERKFDSLEELKTQIQSDAAQTRSFFK